MLTSLQKAPFPFFGGKRHAAPLVWALLGDPMHYVEAFMGSMAVLFERPHPCNRPYHSETVSDTDGLLVNAYRAIQWHPDATAEACSWPVSELDKIARQLGCLEFVASGRVDLLAGSAEWCDPQIAGWWLYGVCCQIGAFHGVGPWTANPVTGRLVKRGLREPWVWHNLPHITDNGQGVHHAGLREPGVSHDLPNLTDDGRGVHHAGLREPGVSHDLPHLGNDGMGVHHAGLREPGVSHDLPHLGNDGMGVHHAGLREPGVSHDLPHLTDNGNGVNRPQLREPGVWEVPEETFHPLTMPELRRWFRWLSARLRHVRIVSGSWTRVVTQGARLTLPVRQGDGVCAVFMDPPYSQSERDGTIYRQDGDVQQAVQAWCLDTGTDLRTRIVLAGYDTEHACLEAHGWTVHEWYTGGFLRGGYGNIDGSSQQGRERLWASPHCLRIADKQLGLW